VRGSQKTTKDSSSSSTAIEKFERNSLNNLLLKSAGAPYEEALKRLIKQKLNDRSFQDGAVRKDIPFEIEKNHGDNVTRSSGSTSNLTRSSSLSSEQRHPIQGDRDARHSDRQMDMNSGVSDQKQQGSARIRAGEAASMHEFQRWLQDNRDVNVHDEDQVVCCSLWYDIV
jgi:hypothetical protein